MEKIVRAEDLPIKKMMVEVEYIEVDGKMINLTPMPHGDIKNYITHIPCKSCGVEFKKHYGYRTTCDKCVSKKELEDYLALPEVEWDGKTPLNLYGDDKYFFSEDDIEAFCEDADLKPENLRLVICTTSSFSEVELDYWQDQVHEEWEPNAAIEEKLAEFNAFMTSQSTNTWWPSDERVTVKL